MSWLASVLKRCEKVISTEESLVYEHCTDVYEDNERTNKYLPQSPNSNNGGNLHMCCLSKGCGCGYHVDFQSQPNDGDSLYKYHQPTDRSLQHTNCCNLYRYIQLSALTTKSYNLSHATPFYAYPPTRHKNCWLSNLLHLLCTFVYYSFIQKFNLTSWLRTCFLIVLVFTMPLHTMSVRIHNFKCPNFKGSFSKGLFISRSYNFVKDFKETQSCSHCNGLCNQLINCAKRGDCAFNNSKKPDYNSSTFIPSIDFAQFSNNISTTLTTTREKLVTDKKYKKFALDLDLFCNHFPMMSLFSMEGNYDYRSQLPYPECSNSTSQLNCEHCKCLEELVRIKEADHLAKGNFLIFSQTMGKYATPDNYTIWPEFKNQCLKSYKAWICSQFHQVYHLNHQCRKVRIKPCNSFCLNVEAACPIFRIFHSTKLRGGQPAFICNGFHIKDDEGSNDICYNSISQLRLTRNGQVPRDSLNGTKTSNPSVKNPPSRMHITRQRHTAHKTTTTSMVENNTTHLNNLASSLHYSFYTMFLASWSILIFFH